MRPVHSGEVRKEDYMVPLGLNAAGLARAVQIPVARITGVIRQQRSVSADMAMSLARHFGGDAPSWLNLQAAYDLRVAEIKNGRRVEREVAPSAARTPLWLEARDALRSSCFGRPPEGTQRISCITSLISHPTTWWR